MRIVIESSILIRSFSDRGPAHAALYTVLSGPHSHITSNEILYETARALRYPRFMSRHQRSESEVYEFIETVRHFSELVEPNPLIDVPIRDPNDAHVMRTAISGMMEVLCTFDRDFFDPPARGFLAECGIEVLSDRELLERLRQ